MSCRHGCFEYDDGTALCRGCAAKAQAVVAAARSWMNWFGAWYGVDVDDLDVYAVERDLINAVRALDDGGVE